MQFNTEYEKMFENIIARNIQYIRDNGVQSLVLGVSGGVDSGLVAALAYHTMRRMPRDERIPIIGRSLPIMTNKQDELDRATAIGTSFCTDFLEFSLGAAFAGLHTTLELDHKKYDGATDIEYKIAMGNIKARIRMIQLYHLARTHKGMVLSTDNLTELLLGFWTLHGDVGDYGMVQNLWKTEVYGLTKWIADQHDHLGQEAKAYALDQCCSAVPTDGLGITDSDLDQLGAGSYAEVDQILSAHGDNRAHPVVRRMINTKFKRDNPYNIPREELLA